MATEPNLAFFNRWHTLPLLRYVLTHPRRYSLLHKLYFLLYLPAIIAFTTYYCLTLYSYLFHGVNLPGSIIILSLILGVGLCLAISPLRRALADLVRRHQHFIETTYTHPYYHSQGITDRDIAAHRQHLHTQTKHHTRGLAAFWAYEAKVYGYLLLSLPFLLAIAVASSLIFHNPNLSPTILLIEIIIAAIIAGTALIRFLLHLPHQLASTTST